MTSDDDDEAGKTQLSLLVYAADVVPLPTTRVRQVCTTLVGADRTTQLVPSVRQLAPSVTHSWRTAGAVIKSVTQSWRSQ